ncbi:MAG: hypothetical protein A4E57_03651 [Syntrophorhabdaceae bacterium PtaU1.Bin034]|jgi:hypothetical protein|nr:MAG: hypothetical protein A4E57_03651 [Syntrophorhabdaceae bacterium PtaU1.Bin034]
MRKTLQLFLLPLTFPLPGKESAQMKKIILAVAIVLVVSLCASKNYRISRANTGL